MKNRILILLILNVIGFSTLYAQNVAVNSTGSMPDTSAMLDVSSVTKGFLMPRMTSTQRDAIVLPATGLTIFNSTLVAYQVNTGTTGLPVWSSFGSASVNSWSLTGNSNTSNSANYLGTTDNVNLRFRTRGIQGMILDTMGNVGIGTSPAFSLTNAEKLLVDAGTGSYNVISGKGNLNSYLQLNIKNTNGGSAASSDVVATNDAGNESNQINYIDMGVNSSGYSSAGILGGASNAYLYATGNDFIIGNNTPSKPLRFFTTASAGSAEAMRIDSIGNIGIGTTSPLSKLHILGINPLSLSGVQLGTATTADSLLTINSGVVQKLPISAFSGGGSWSLSGNTGTSSSTNFLGTTDAQDVVFKANGTERLRIVNGVSTGSGTAGDITFGDANSGTARSNKEFVMREDGDQYGSSTLRLRNRNGENGAIFETIGTTPLGAPSPALVDFLFKTGTAASPLVSNLRFETRAVGQGMFLSGNSMEWQIGQPANPTMIFSAATSGNSDLRLGNLGINNVSPSEKLDVTGNVKFSGALMPGGTAGTSGYVLTSAGTGTPTWTAPAGNQTITFNPTGDVTATSNNTGTTTLAPVLAIGANKVLNTMLAKAAALSIKGNNTTGLANEQDLTVAQVNLILPVFTTSLNGLVPLSGGSARKVLHADGTWKDTTSTTNQWSTTGNSGTYYLTNFIGTTDTNSFRVRVNNLQSMLVNQLGNVGIGATPTFATSNPEKLLVDAGTSSYNVISGKGNLNSYLQLNIQNLNNGTSASSDIVATNDLGTEANAINYVDLGINSSGNASTGVLGGANTGYLYSTGNDFSIGNATPLKSLIFFTGGIGNNEKMRIDSSGNVGIGTTNPATKLQVNGTNPLTLNGVQLGNVSTDSLLTIAGGLVKKLPLSTFSTPAGSWATTGNAGTDTLSNFIGTTDNKNFLIKTNNSQRIKIDSTGNVGIGTSPVFDAANPDKLLVDAQTTTSNVITGVGNINSYLQLNIQNKNNGTQASSDLIATANNGTASTVYIDMGINGAGYYDAMAGPLALLNGPNLAYLYATGDDFYIGNSAIGKSLVFFTNSSETKGGYGIERVRIVDTSFLPGANNLYSLGSPATSWKTLYTRNIVQTSDRRLKTNIQNLAYGLKEVLQLEPVRYNWKTNPGADNKIGLIAQDVRKIVPEVVAGNEAKENLGINYSELIPVLINAIKEQQQQIDTLKKDIQVLKAGKTRDETIAVKSNVESK